MLKRDSINQLQVINALLARVSGIGLEQEMHVQKALDYFSREINESIEPENVRFKRFIRIVLQLYNKQDNIAVAHWHALQVENFSPLWIHRALISKMKILAGRHISILLITGLREAVYENGVYWTRARSERYKTILGWIDDLACNWGTNGANMHVIVL